MKNLFFYSVLILFLMSSCKKEAKVQPKKGLNLCYVILDKSSNSYSDLGGEEENYISLDTLYLREWIDTLCKHINGSLTKNDLILFFNYVDKDSKGNRELYLRIPAFEAVDSLYKPQMGQIESSREKHLIQVKHKLYRQAKERALYEKAKEQLLVDIQSMLSKSQLARGSDCSGALTRANQKLASYLEIKKENQVKSRTIIAFSDLVNFPVNNDPLSIDYTIIRPGFTSEVSYLKDGRLVNVSTQEEFDQLMFNLLEN